MRITTIQINGEPFSYQDEIDDITYETISPISNSEAKDLLELTKLLFSQKGLKFCLIFGTLLGAVRDKSVIVGDEDVDVLSSQKKNFEVYYHIYRIMAFASVVFMKSTFIHFAFVGVNSLLTFISKAPSQVFGDIGIAI